MKGITKNNEVVSLISQRDKSLQYLQQLLEKTVIEANELAEKIKQEAESEAAKVREEVEAVQKEAAQVMEKAEATQKEAALLMEKAEEEARKVIGEAQGRADEAVTEAKELAERVKQEAQGEAAKVKEETEATRTEAAQVIEKAEATQKEAAQLMEEAKEKAKKVVSEAQRQAYEAFAEAKEQADQAVAEAKEQADRIKQEAESGAANLIEKAEAAQKEAVQVIEKAEVTQKGVNAIIEALRKQILSDMDIIRDKFLPSLENLSAEIAGGENAIKGKEQALLQVAEELGATASCAPISDIKGNGHRETLEAEVNLKSEFATMAAASGQAVENAIPTDFVDESVKLPPFSDASATFEGEVEIAILPPVDMAQLIQLRRNLLDTPYLKILRTAGSWNEGTVITVVVDEPVPLVSMLMEMPEVEKVELWAGREGSDGDFRWDLAFELKPGCQRKRVLVTLKKELG